ncbi:MAG: P1 family peptidase [Chloroflexaceae bacterium]|nr:P1 family peptidase [Chloroflexaceae bacterium]
MINESPKSITDVVGIQVGHAHDAEALTGCTVVLAPPGTVGSVDVRGGGPGTRETDLLNPLMSVNEVHAIALCGGSAMGLAAASGVATWLHERGIGYHVGVAHVPLVPAAVIFDLLLGRADRWADATMGYAACSNATTDAIAEGCVGVGMGATVGKILGAATATKSGVGTWSEHLFDGTIIGALAVCNAFGDVLDERGQILAGAREPTHGGFADARKVMRSTRGYQFFHRRRAMRMPSNADDQDAGLQHTTLGVVATNAQLNKMQANRVAQIAQDALPRSIWPVHTPLDGDTVFVLATGQHDAPEVTMLGSIAADVLQQAIRRCVTQAVSMGGLPAIRDLPTGT